MERFLSVSVRIQNVSPKVAFTSMIKALKSNPFLNSLCKKPPTTLDEFRTRVVGFIQMEVMIGFKEKMHGKPLRKLAEREV